ncbi:MAG TPA: DUF4097 family beta strand repeat-containing protein [Blastocatellia bacterium]|nr:DUF4097 family beta strand repeat-containing protein [Blastocatellia bacterium]
MSRGKVRKIRGLAAIIFGCLLLLNSGGRFAKTSAAGQGSQDREFHQTYDLAPNGIVAVFNSSGNIRISTWDRNQVKVDAVKQGRREEDFSRVQIQVTPRADRVEIRAVYPTGYNWRNGGVSVNFDIKLPRTATINPANSSSGDITIVGPVERVVARTSSGNISAGDVKDTANLSTSSGNIRATRIGGELRATAGSGDLILTELGSRLIAQSSSGSIQATDVRDDAMATVASGEVRLEKIGGRAVGRTSSGSVWINDVAGDAQGSTMSDNVTVTNVKGRATISAISGNVTVRNVGEGVRAGTISGTVSISDCKGVINASSTSDTITLTNIDSRDVIAKTTSGNVRFTGKIQEGGRYEFESFNGSVVLNIPADSNFNLTAKTYNGTINTEFPVQLTRTTGGTLMSGTVGKGGVDVIVSSFNGSVQIKKMR